MTTREMYAVCSEGLITVGLSVDTPGQWPDGIRALCADTQSRGGTLDEFEAAVKRRWPGRPYWIEWGDDNNWVQVVEFGAFENKEHKREICGAPPIARNGH